MRWFLFSLFVSACPGVAQSQDAQVDGAEPGSTQPVPPRAAASLPSKEALATLKFERLRFRNLDIVRHIKDQPAEKQLDFGRGPANFHAFQLPETSAPYVVSMVSEMTGSFSMKEPKLMEPWILLLDADFGLLTAAEPGQRFQLGINSLWKVPTRIVIPVEARYMLVVADPTLANAGEFFITDYALHSSIGYVSRTHAMKAEVAYATHGKVRFRMPFERPRGPKPQ